MESTTGKFLTEEARRAQAQEQRKAEFDQRWEKVRAVICLILCDGAMLAIILNGKIDNFIGMLFLIGISAYFGGQMK